MPAPPDPKAIFATAADIADPRERAAYLNSACAGDTALLQQVEALLNPHGHPGDLPGQLAPAAGTMIAGRYRLLELIGQGGMGVVWMAEQREPVRRTVAVKLIKAGMDSGAVLARFDAERQALALMDHPNIARVFDGGTTQAGRPFFAMELVKGLPLTEYCDSRRLPVAERLGLFVQICAAVQHAHQKGVIHRDLKPSNVLVTEYDGRPVPKVIDFGLAKALKTADLLTEQTLHTAFGTVVGTLLYMAPEQVALNAVDVDTRADIYALGVLLYELLTGTTPLNRKRLSDGSWDEVQRIIREEEPPRPSARLSSSDALPSLAANRQTEPRKLTGLVKGELDWIVMKALEKDRDRRYETANGLSLDVQRHLAGEPVLAHPPSSAYRLRKLLRRHRGPVVATTTVALALVVGLAGTTWGLVRTEQARADEAEQRREAEQARADEAAQRAVAEENERKADTATKDERAAREESQKRFAQVEKAHQIISQVFDILDPKVVEEGESVRAIHRERLMKVARQLEGEAVGDPLMVASLQNRLGNVLLGLGYPNDAIALFEKVRDTRIAKLGRNHADTITITAILAALYRANGKIMRALDLLKETFELRKANLGPTHPDTLNNMRNLATAYLTANQPNNAVSTMNDLLAIQEKLLGPDSPRLAGLQASLADGLVRYGYFRHAEPILRECLALRERVQPDAWATFQTKSLLGEVLLGRRKSIPDERYMEAERLLRGAYKGMEQGMAKMPKQGPARLRETVERLVRLYERWGKRQEAAEWRKKLEALP